MAALDGITAAARLSTGHADTVDEPRERIQNRMVREVEAMALFALATGAGVPPDLMDQLDKGLTGVRPASLSKDPAAASPETAVITDNVVLLAGAHASLSKLISPARPGALLLLIEDRREHPILNSFGAVPLVRRQLAIAVISLVIMLGMALSSNVNTANMAKGLLNLQGIQLLANEIFLVAAAGVGASLANLKRLNQYISDCTYERRYDSSYWTRLVMGIISGTLLSQILYSAVASADHSTANSFSQPLLAVLGGFSAELVHDILTHFITVIGNMFGGKPITPPPATDAKP